MSDDRHGHLPLMEAVRIGFRKNDTAKPYAVLATVVSTCARSV